MLKRLIEVALPLKEVSEQSAREKSIRHGHISTLHIWWARRPLAACRAAVFASLIPDPDDPECPESFRKLVKELLSRNEFKPKNGDGFTVEDTPRNRCLEFIKHLVKWENSNNSEYIEPARKLITAAHKFLHPHSEGDAPIVLDPFAGGGAIPLESLRLGCESLAVDLNPVAHLIELCTLVYPQKYGQPDSRLVPDYISQLIAQNRWRKRVRGQETGDLFAEDLQLPPHDELIPDIEITEAEYLSNPLAADVKYWGHWILRGVEQEIGEFYQVSSEGRRPTAFLWARTVTCENPTCRATVPLFRQLWLSNKTGRRIALEPILDRVSRTISFSIRQREPFPFDPSQGTALKGKVRCPFCEHVCDGKYLKAESTAGRLGQQLMAVVEPRVDGKGNVYRLAEKSDLVGYSKASRRLAQKTTQWAFGLSILPEEAISKQQPRVLFVQLYGLTQWRSLFNDRQALSLVTFGEWILRASDQLRSSHCDPEYAKAISTVLALCFSSMSHYLCTSATWLSEGLISSFILGGNIPMKWDYAEGNPFGHLVGTWRQAITKVGPVFVELGKLNKGKSATCLQASATRLPYPGQSLHAIITDPPYYDQIPYAECADFFYVWLRRILGREYAELFRSPLTPKSDEIIEQRPHSSLKSRKDKEFFERKLSEVFAAAQEALHSDGVACVMYAHKTTTAWERLISSLLHGRLMVTSSWAFHTERDARMRANQVAALASSVTLVCRKRPSNAGCGFWDDVRQELKTVAQERLDFFWNQGIRGADFFISAIGPALSVFGKHGRVTKLSGEEVTVGQFLDEVRSLVTSYALAKILKTTHTGTIDPESRFYVVWKWSYGDAKVPADESFKLAEALGMNTDLLWDKTGVLEKSGENVLATPISKRVKIKNLGEPAADGTPASLIDVLHRMCAFREKSDTQGMAQFLNRSGHANNHSLWLIAQAVSEILLDGDKEKQLMQGLLNQKDRLVEATRQGELF